MIRASERPPFLTAFLTSAVKNGESVTYQEGRGLCPLAARVGLQYRKTVG